MTPTLPNPPDPPSRVPLSDALRKYLTDSVSAYMVTLIRALRQTYPGQVVDVGLDRIQFAVPVTPAPNGSITAFVVAPTIRRDPQKRAQALVMVDGVVVPYDDGDPPEPGLWTLRTHQPTDVPPQELVFGTPPVGRVDVLFAIVM